MNTPLAAKLAPWTGPVFVVLMVGWFFTTPGDVLDDPEALASDYANELGLFIGGAQMAAIAAAALLWFSGTVASALAANGAGDRLAGIARSSGTAAAALLLGGTVILAIGAVRADEDGQIAAGSASVLFDVGGVLALWAMPVAAGVLVAATAIGSLHGNRFLPYGLDWASLVLAVTLLIVLINWVAVWVFFAWVLVVAALMIAGRLTFEEPATSDDG